MGSATFSWKRASAVFTGGVVRTAMSTATTATTAKERAKAPISLFQWGFFFFCSVSHSGGRQCGQVNQRLGAAHTFLSTMARRKRRASAVCSVKLEAVTPRLCAASSGGVSREKTPALPAVTVTYRAGQTAHTHTHM